jgi:hypothetical protein
MAAQYCKKIAQSASVKTPCDVIVGASRFHSRNPSPLSDAGGGGSALK